MNTITDSVGVQGANRADDTKAVQALLNNSGHTWPRLYIDGNCGPKTVAAIREYQSEVLGFVRPDGLVEPGGRTLAALVARQEESPSPPSRDVLFEDWINPGRLPLGRADFLAAAQELRCEVAAVMAVTEVEAGKSGFLPSGRPKILFEAHLFSDRTGGKFDASHPGISSPSWNRSLYRGGEAEYERLEQAMALHDGGALCSASWGRFQILGTHYKRCGFPTPRDFVKAMFSGERAHLDAFGRFVAADAAMLGALRRRDWETFARLYNGAGYRANRYDERLAAAFRRFAA